MRNSVIVNKMLEYIDKVQGYIFGLVVHLDDKYKVDHPEIPWAKISGLRHHIVHDYEGIVASIIWDTITNSLPELKKQLSVIST